MADEALLGRQRFGVADHESGEAVSLAGIDNGVACKFVLLERDTAQTPELQARTIETIRSRCACDVERLDAGHMAMYSHPQQVADAAGTWFVEKFAHRAAAAP